MCVWQKRKNIAIASGVKNRGMCLDSSTAADKHTSRWVFVRRLCSVKHTKIHTKYVGAPLSQNCYPPIYILLCRGDSPLKQKLSRKAQLLFHSSKSSLLISRCLALDRELSALCTPTTGLPYYHHACLTCYGWYLYWKYGITLIVLIVLPPPLCLLHRIKIHTVHGHPLLPCHSLISQRSKGLFGYS